MSQDIYTAVDQFFMEKLTPADAALDKAVETSIAAGLPPIQVTPTQGKFLHILARSVNARHILEIGTLGAYSTIWLARALPSAGKLISLEANPKHAELSRKNIANAGLSDRVEIRLGLGLESLPKLAAEKPVPFDLVFIDANKDQMPEYFDWAIKLTRVGGFIVGDNVARHGEVIEANSKDPDVHGARRYLEIIGRDPRVISTALQTVGVKGYDGFALSLVVGK
jgi:predicted O-methyltransferase YrrM